ncbi:RNA recognition motif domain-containing protein [Mucilaginibacter sp. AW1-7]|uniref:RNA recognition motif domain-containing protein n=1 Tax=Mucilaginibacter sp. AW1-7 TaxID=3349874 RepID=UPI003F73CFE0
MVKLFIVGIPRDMEEIELLEIFTLYGQVEQVKIITDIDTGQSKGYGFINMADEPGAIRAIDALNGATIDDREISVRLADDKRPAPEPPKQPFKKSFTPKNQYQKVNPHTSNEKQKRPRRPF